MIIEIYKRALSVLLQKPFRLWALSILSLLLMYAASILFSVPLGLGICITMLLSTSMTMVYLHGYRGEQVEAKQLFECFKSWDTVKRVCCGLGWKWMWIALWSLIPVVGWVFAIIRSYEYWLTPYILVYEPEISLTDAIKVSKERTMGYKSKMFWSMVLIPVAIFVVVLVLGLLSTIRFIGALFGLVLFLFLVVTGLLYQIFTGLVCAAWYEEITNPTYVASRPVYQAPVQPTYQEPTQPVYQAPVQPTYQEPAQPVYQAPAAPVAPAYEAPAAPAYEAPAAPETPAEEAPAPEAPAAPEAPRASFCPNCGNRAEPGDIFCNACGTRL